MVDVRTRHVSGRGADSKRRADRRDLPTVDYVAGECHYAARTRQTDVSTLRFAYFHLVSLRNCYELVVALLLESNRPYVTLFDL